MSTVGQQFTFTSNATWTVPSDVGSIQIQCIGGQGGSGGLGGTSTVANIGSFASLVAGNLTGCMSKSLDIYIGFHGGSGSGGKNYSSNDQRSGGGGGGGGSSAVLLNGSIIIQSKGGNGGKGLNGSGSATGAGGNGGVGYINGIKGNNGSGNYGGAGGNGGGADYFGGVTNGTNSGTASIESKIIITILTLALGKYLIQQNSKIYTLNPSVYGGTLPTNIQDLIVAKTLSEEQTALDVLTSTDIDNYATNNFDDVKQIRALFTGTKYKILKFKAQ